jgi:hypothetical protein
VYAPSSSQGDALPRPILIAAALLATLVLAASAHAATFSGPAALPNSLPSSDPNHPQRQGGEPSLTFDPGGRLVYAASPGGAQFGGNFWRSTDGGQTWSQGISVGSIAGGGDSDVAVGYDPKHTVFYIDLEDLVASDLCSSTDQGQTFPSNGCDTGFATNQQQPIVDRPWINTAAAHPGLLYGTYDGLAFGGGAPEVQQSSDGGATFSNCGQVLQPGSDAFAHFSATGALENSETIGKPAIGPEGSIYVPFTEPHMSGQQASEPADPTPDNLYVGIGRGGCPSATSTFQDVTVYKNDQGKGSGFADIFPYAAVDAGGYVYMLGDGHLTGDQNGLGVYLFVSRDGGLHWSAPIQVDPGAPHASQVATLAAGNGPGEAIIGWYESPNPDSNSSSAVWRYKIAETFDAGKTFSTTTVTPDPMHYGAICDLGVECTGGRNLLDFTSVAVNPVTGCGFAVFAGDPYDTPQNGKTDAAAAYYVRQTGGPCLTGATANAPALPNHGVPVRKATPKLALSVRPRTVLAGTCTRFSFKTTTGSGRHRHVVAHALVRFDRHSARTNRRGVATIRGCLPRAGRYRAKASARGYAGASAAVRARRRARFTG